MDLLVDSLIWGSSLGKFLSLSIAVVTSMECSSGVRASLLIGGGAGFGTGVGGGEGGKGGLGGGVEDETAEVGR